MGNHYLSKINVRFFKDDGTPDVETAKRIYDEFQEIIEADYEGMSVKDGLITSEGFFYDEGIGGCVKCLKEKAPDCIYQGLYYTLKEGEDDGGILAFHSPKKLKDANFHRLNYRIDELVDKNGKWTWLNRDDCSALFSIDENKNEVLEKECLYADDHTDVMEKNDYYLKYGFPVVPAPEGTKFYTLKLSDFKEMLNKVLKNSTSDKIYLYLENDTLTISDAIMYDSHLISTEMKNVPLVSISINMKIAKCLLEQLGNEGDFSIGLQPETKDNVYFRYDGKETCIDAYIRFDTQHNLFEGIKKEPFLLELNKNDFSSALQEIYDVIGKEQPDSYYLDRYSVECSLEPNSSRLNISIEKEIYVLKTDKEVQISEKREVNVLSVINNSTTDTINFSLTLFCAKILQDITADKISIFISSNNAKDNFGNDMKHLFIVPDSKADFIEYLRFTIKDR